MKLTNEMQVEIALLQFLNTVAQTTLDTVEKNTDLPMLDTRKAFATGVMCVMEAIEKSLKPKLLAIVKENPKYFENLN